MPKKTTKPPTEQSMCFIDVMEFDDAAKPRITADGFLVAQPRVARIGIQKYKGIEVGLPDQEMVSVYRPEDEVFAGASISSYAHRPVTNDHPPEWVTADTWKKYAVGQIDGEVVRDGTYIRVPMMVMDKQAIKDIQAGKSQLSAGYHAKLVWGKGVTPQGEAFDAMQTNIRINHVAICSAARGGPMLCLGDSFAVFSEAKTRDREPPARRKRMARQIVVDSVNVEIEDDTAAQVVDRYVKKIEGELATLRTQLADAASAKQTNETAMAEIKRQIETKDGEIAAVKRQLTDATLSPEKVDALVQERVQIVGKARAILGDGFSFEGKSNPALMREAVAKKLGDVASMSDAAIEGAFKALTSGAAVRDAAHVFSGTPIHSSADASKAAAATAYDQRTKELEDAWKPKLVSNK